MKFNLFSILAGTEACNAQCPFCVSKMTPLQGFSIHEFNVNWRNFKIAAMLAKNSGVETVMITGKGEPTLFPEQITRYLEALKQFEFPFIELQTNGLLISDKKEEFKNYLRKWYDLGLTTIALSITHYDSERNRQIYTPLRKKYPELKEIIDLIHSYGYSVRLACIVLNGFIDSKDEIEKLIKFSKDNNVEQLTYRPVNKPEYSRNRKIYEWTIKNHLTKEKKTSIRDYLDTNGTVLLKMPYGGAVYDIGGQNVCFTTSLTRNKDQDKVRQLIFFPDGHIRYDWEKPGATLL